MAAGKRSPTAHRTPEQTATAWGDRSEKSKSFNKERMQIRRDAVKAGKVKKFDGKDVSHGKALSKGGSSKASNLSIQSASKNRAHGMSPGGTKKGTTIASGPKKKAKGNPYT